MTRPRTNDVVTSVAICDGRRQLGEVVEHPQRLGLPWAMLSASTRTGAPWPAPAEIGPASPNDKELRFISDMARWRGTPSDRQLEWLRLLFERIRTEAAA